MKDTITVTGNDLNWDSVIMLNSFNADLESAIFEGEIELDENGYVTDEDYTRFQDMNPIVVYYKGDLDIQKLMKDDIPLDDVIDWYIIHDTNDNFVELVGEVPEEYLF